MKINNIRLEALRYQRAYRFTEDALYTLCSASGGMRDRLQKIDKEFFTISMAELPENDSLRANFQKLHDFVTSKEASYANEGKITATLSQLHHTKLKKITQLIWDIYTEFSSFMLMNDENNPI